MTRERNPTRRHDESSARRPAGAAGLLTPLDVVAGRRLSSGIQSPSAVSPWPASPFTSPTVGFSSPVSGGSGRTGSGSRLDRFIANRRAVDLEGARLSLFSPLGGDDDRAAKAADAYSADGAPQSAPPAKVVSPMTEEYRRRLAQGLGVNVDRRGGRLLSFTEPRRAARSGPMPSDFEDFENSDPLPLAQSSGRKEKQLRAIPTGPEKILDAPDILDDYYLNLLDWGPSNVLAVALDSSVYLWNATTGGIQELMQCDDAEEYVTSVAWAADGKHVAIGTSSAEVKIWDSSSVKLLRTLPGHSARVGSLAWNGNILSTGGRDGLVINHDTRQRNHQVAVLRGHEQEVCGLRWSPSGSQLASGGNDNILCLWDGLSPSQATHRINSHQAAVKALAWCPWQSNLLASGGGTADRCIKFWNSSTGAELNSIDTNSQVCALQWNTHEREILSSHGFSQNQLCLWKYPSMKKLAEFNGHTSRVLHMAQSPDGGTVCSAAADETLRFWRCFAEPSSSSRMKSPADSKLRSIRIRYCLLTLCTGQDNGISKCP